MSFPFAQHPPPMRAWRDGYHPPKQAEPNSYRINYNHTPRMTNPVTTVSSNLREPMC